MSCHGAVIMQNQYCAKYLNNSQVLFKLVLCPCFFVWFWVSCRLSTVLYRWIFVSFLLNNILFPLEFQAIQYPHWKKYFAPKTKDTRRKKSNNIEQKKNQFSENQGALFSFGWQTSRGQNIFHQSSRKQFARGDGKEKESGEYFPKRWDFSFSAVFHIRAC